LRWFRVAKARTANLDMRDFLDLLYRAGKTAMTRHYQEKHVRNALREASK
jgi:hypothetical protein